MVEGLRSGAICCQEHAFGPDHRGSSLFVFDVQPRAMFHQERQNFVRAAIGSAEYWRQGPWSSQR